MEAGTSSSGCATTVGSWRRRPHPGVVEEASTWPGRDSGGPRRHWDRTAARWLSSDAPSPGLLLLHHGLLDAGVDPDLRNLNGGRRWWHSSGGSNRSWPGGDAALAFIFELAWRICIEERECEFWYCLSPQLQICIAFCNACWSPNQLCTVPDERHFCLCLVLLDSV
jgi:hypothetical protein